MTTGNDGFLRNNLFLVAAVLLPVVVIAFFLVATAIPRWLVPPPAYDLVVRVGKPYDGTRMTVATQFRVRDGQLEAVVKPLGKDVYEANWALFVFDHTTLNLTQVPVRIPDTLPADSPPQTVTVDALAGRRILEQTVAPDGYQLRSDAARGGPGIVGDLFGMRSYDRNAALINKGRVVPIPLPSTYQYLSPVTAIGWIADAR